MKLYKSTLSVFSLIMISTVGGHVHAESPTKTQLPRAAGIESKGYVWNSPDEEINRLTQRKADIAKGKTAYVVCRGCHKADASGRKDALYPQLAGQHPSVLIKQMVDVRAGRRDSPKMRPFLEKDVVSSNDLADIAAYLYSLPTPASNGKGEGKDLDLGKHLYERDCGSCHGKTGQGDGAKFYPRVAGQHYAYLVQETRESRDKGRRNSNPEMVKVVKHYVDADIAAVSDYMSRLTVR